MHDIWIIIAALTTFVAIIQTVRLHLPTVVHAGTGNQMMGYGKFLGRHALISVPRRTRKGQPHRIGEDASAELKASRLRKGTVIMTFTSFSSMEVVEKNLHGMMQAFIGEAAIEDPSSSDSSPAAV